MLNKFSCLCLIIIIINAVVNPALTWADVNKNLKNNMQNRQDTSTSGSRLFNDATNAYQPYIPNRKWLLQTPTFTTTMSKSTATATTTTSTPLMIQSSDYKHHIYKHHNHHTHDTHHYSTHYGNQEQKQQQQQQQQQLKLQVREYNGNYQKHHVNMTKLISSQITPTQINTLTTSSVARSNIENSFNSHASLLLYNPSNMVNTVNSQIQIPKDIISEAYNSQRSQQWQIESHPQKKKISVLSQPYVPHVTDIEEKNYQAREHYHQHASTIWPQSYYPINVNDIQQKHISFDSLNPDSNVNANDKTDMKKKNLKDSNILTKASQQNFKTNEISNDNVDIDVPNHADDADDDKQFSKPNVLKTVTTSSNHGDGKYLNLKLTLLKKIFNNNPTLYDNSKDIHVIPCDKRQHESDRSNIRHGNDDDTSYSYPNEGKFIFIYS